MKEIETREDIIAAVKADTGDKKIRRHIIKRSIDLGCIDDVPDDWELELKK